MTDKLIYLFEKSYPLSLSEKQIEDICGEYSDECLKKLIKMGFEISRDTNGGYLLKKSPAVTNKQIISEYLDNFVEYSFEIFDSVDSTNTYLKKLAESGAPSNTVVISETQTAGRGRMDRRFLSPLYSGIYLSILLRPDNITDKSSPSESTAVTACAAVAASEAIKEVTGKETAVKWVNDLFCKGKKVCGILTEGVIDTKNNGFEYIIIGIGINLSSDFSGTEINNSAASIFSENEEKDLCLIKNRIIACLLNRLSKYCKAVFTGHTGEIFEKYKKKLFIIGKTVDIITSESSEKALILSINGDFSLNVQYGDGRIRKLYSGEVRLKLK